MVCLQVMLKCADVGHTYAALPVHKQWTDRFQYEMFLQVRHALAHAGCARAVAACGCSLPCLLSHQQPAQLCALQGDKEASFGLPVSALCNRQSLCVASSQVSSEQVPCGVTNICLTVLIPSLFSAPCECTLAGRLLQCCSLTNVEELCNMLPSNRGNVRQGSCK